MATTKAVTKAPAKKPAATKMTQTAFVKAIAEIGGVTNKAAKDIVENYAQIAIAQTKKHGVFVSSRSWPVEED